MKKKKRLSYGISVVLAIAIVLTEVFLQDIGSAENAQETFRLLSDAFLFAGILTGGVGAMSWIAAKGNFDMLTYGFNRFFSFFIHAGRRPESFYEYKMRKEEKGEGWWKEGTIVGGISLLLCVLCTVMYYLV